MLLISLRLETSLKQIAIAQSTLAKSYSSQMSAKLELTAGGCELTPEFRDSSNWKLRNL